jgi:hypothetical protein
MLSMVSVNASGLGMNSPEIQFSNALCNRSGPTPRIRISGEGTRHGRISKEGSPFMRSVMIRAATVASCKSNRWYGLHATPFKRCEKKGANLIAINGALNTGA